MADVAWVALSIWPWRDEWLTADGELCEAFAALGLVGAPRELVGAMNGYREDDDGKVVLTGEMLGGSYEIREDSSLLETLRDRGIAYELVGDAKYDWDGDQTFWHPGMDEPSSAPHCNDGRFLTESMARAMLLEESPLDSLRAFFDASSEWVPPDGYEPRLKVAEASS